MSDGTTTGPSSDVVVRRVLPGDGDLVRTVRLAALADAPHAFASTFAAESELTDDDWRERARRGATSDEIALFVAVGPDGVLGTVGGVLRSGAPSLVELISMWVAPPARRTGLASRLIDAVVDWTRSIGVDRVELWVVRGNDVAQRRYESDGFALTPVTAPVPGDPCREEVRMVRHV